MMGERGRGGAELARARQKLDFLKKRKIAKYFRKFHKFGRVLPSKLFQNTRILKPFIVQKIFQNFKKSMKNLKVRLSVYIFLIILIENLPFFQTIKI